MTDPRIEAAARALCEIYGHDPDADESMVQSGMGANWLAYEDEARAALSAADAAAWRPIETAPKDTTILTHYADGRVMADEFPYRGMLEWQEQLDEPPIHWQPLPAPPASSADFGGRDG